MGARKQDKKTKQKAISEDARRGEALAAVIASANKALGVEGAVFLGKDMPAKHRHRTGLVALDYVSGGGFRDGDLIVFTGADSCYKTTAAMIVCATAQEDDDDAYVVWLAGEPFDQDWAAHNGMDLRRTIVVTAAHGDTALETACTLLETNAVSVLVLDSFQSLGSTRELEGGIESESFGGGGAAQMWGRVMRRAYAASNRGSRTRIIGISQVRAKIGGFSHHGPPPPEGIGVYAIKHWKAVDIEFKRGDLVTEGDEEKKSIHSVLFKVNTKKNKTAAPFRSSSILVEYGKAGAHPNNAATLFKLGVKYGLIKCTGAWYEGAGIPKTNGKDAFVSKLKHDAEAQEVLEDQLKELYAQG